jgi:hypothetical protein
MRLVEDYVPSNGHKSKPHHAVAAFTCCRDWICEVFEPMGKCGLCGKRPERNGSQDRTDNGTDQP